MSRVATGVQKIIKYEFLTPYYRLFDTVSTHFIDFYIFSIFGREIDLES